MFTRVISHRNPDQTSSLSVEKRRFTQQKTMNKGSSLNKSQQLKPFCKICFDTGKLEQIYNSHFVRETRDPNSRIICPTLLAMECRYCFLKGHTVSKCPKLAMAQSGKNVNDAPMKQKIIVKCCDDTASCSSNGFSSLYYSDNEDEEDTLKDLSTASSEIFPNLNKKLIFEERGRLIVTSTTPVKRSYAAVALMATNKTEEDDLSCVTVSVSSYVAESGFSSAKHASLENVKVNLDKESLQQITLLPDDFVVLQPSGIRKTFTHVNKYKNRSWADDSDSDEE